MRVHWLVKAILVAHTYLISPHACRVCHMKSGPLADVEITPQPLTPQAQNDSTPGDNDGGSDDAGTPVNPKPGDRHAQ